MSSKELIRINKYLSEIGNITTCLGDSHNGKSPPKCSIRNPINLSCVPRGALWMHRGVCSLSLEEYETGNVKTENREHETGTGNRKRTNIKQEIINMEMHNYPIPWKIISSPMVFHGLG